MKNITKKTSTWTNKDTFNMVMGLPLNSVLGAKMTVRAMAVGEDVDKETGETHEMCSIVSITGDTYSSISSTACEQVDALIDIFEEENYGEIEIFIDGRKNKAGNRTYIALSVC